MTKLNISEKAARTGKLLWAMRHPAIAAKLAPFGFTSKVLDEGWTLVDTANDRQLARVVSRSSATGNSDIVATVESFENRWFPIVKHALDRRNPEATKQLFLNLGRSEGQTSAYSVRIFVDRLAALGKGEAPFGEEGPAAREYLRGRGLTDNVIAEVVAELEGRKEVAEEVVPFDEAALAAAEAAVWAFYLDWSNVVRSVITDGNLLRLCGFKKRTGGPRTPKAPQLDSVESTRGEASGAEASAGEAPADEAVDEVVDEDAVGKGVSSAAE